jgi:hypothetical protein
VNIIRVKKSRSVRAADRKARMGAMRNAYKIFVGNLNLRENLESLDVDGRVILDWPRRNRIIRCGLNSSGSGQGLVAVL